MFTIYRLPHAQWAAQQGALAGPPGGATERVATLGAPPPGAAAGPLRWTALLRAPRYWNYGFRIGPGPARLTIDGNEVLTVPAGTPTGTVLVSLARGDHSVVYDGTLAAAGQPALFQWGMAEETAPDVPPALPTEWQSVPAERLRSVAERHGLYGVVSATEERPAQQRIDGTLATCCLTGQTRHEGPPYSVTWTGTLTAPVSGLYPMTLYAEGVIELTLDGRTVIRGTLEDPQPLEGEVTLEAGSHAVEITYQVQNTGGGIEWTWTPPGGDRSLVPPTVLAPPPGAGVGPPVPYTVLGHPDRQPIDPLLDVVK
jgi:hypothetical protein